jgi:hypothetical protein
MVGPLVARLLRPARRVDLAGLPAIWFATDWTEVAAEALVRALRGP